MISNKSRLSRSGVIPLFAFALGEAQIRALGMVASLSLDDGFWLVTSSSGRSKPAPVCGSQSGDCHDVERI